MVQQILLLSEQPLPYHVAKAGLNQLSKYYANNLGKHSVRVNIVEPGLVDNKRIKKKFVKSNKILIPLQKQQHMMRFVI